VLREFIEPYQVRIKASSGGCLGLVRRWKSARRLDRCCVMIGWVAICTSTSVRPLELRIAFVEGHTCGRRSRGVGKRVQHDRRASQMLAHLCVAFAGMKRSDAAGDRCRLAPLQAKDYPPAAPRLAWRTARAFASAWRRRSNTSGSVTLRRVRVLAAAVVVARGRRVVELVFSARVTRS
jgi:hypothetical protein